MSGSHKFLISSEMASKYEAGVSVAIKNHFRYTGVDTRVLRLREINGSGTGVESSHATAMDVSFASSLMSVSRKGVSRKSVLVRYLTSKVFYVIIVVLEKCSDRSSRGYFMLPPSSLEPVFLISSKVRSRDTTKVHLFASLSL